ncbi:MAG: PrsW family intramembrane metalloprotease [Lachnospiraceae bacterium]|nr:PrsW family intramembrane metalloprotease [Lachnospiraceae bacterium]
MNYIENVFVCMVAPLIVAIICANDKGKRSMLFLLIGMTACLLSSYISTFIAAAQGANILQASLEISPLVEVSMKIFPILLYLLVFEPDREGIAISCLMTAIGFATFENVCFLMQNGAEKLTNLAIRGFGTGAMHVVCANIIAIGLLRIWKNELLRVAGTVALLAVAITYHGVFNVLVSQTGTAALIGYLIPFITAIAGLVIRRHLIFMKPNIPTEK